MYRIAKIELNSGATLLPGDLTVAVGPNNGGKSRFLNELVSCIATPSQPRVSIGTAHPAFPDGVSTLFSELTKNVQIDPSGQAILDAPSPDYREPQQLRLNKAAVGIGLDTPLRDEDKRVVIRDYLGRHLVGHLTTESRLLLVKRQVNRRQNIEGAQSAIEAAYEGDQTVSDWINERLYAAFGTRLVLDDTIFAAAEFRLGNTQDLSQDRAARRRKMEVLPELDEQGDGIRAFAGVLIAITAFRRPVLAIDEPEAFLHPPQAYLMGRALAEYRNRGAQLFVATHSAEVLRGILSVTTDVTVVRFSREGDGFVSKILDAGKLKQIATDPVLLSGRVLNGLFYRGVAITESDGDVVLYRAVLESIDQSSSLEFVNSYSKQLSARVAIPFTAMGVRCAVVVDFDALRVSEEFRQLYEAMGGEWSEIADDYRSLIDTLESADDALSRLGEAICLITKAWDAAWRRTDAPSRLRGLVRVVKEIREKASIWEDLKRTGVGGLSGDVRNACEHILRACERRGVFVCTAGEREAWLAPEVPYSKNKRAWTQAALTFLNGRRLSTDHPLMHYVAAVRSYCLGP